MNEERTLSGIFTQLISCDQCGKSLFEIAALYKKDFSIRCGECGATFKVYAEKGNEAISRTLTREQVRNQDRLSELLQIRLYMFESQVEGYGQNAATLFQNYIENLYDSMLEGIDGMILKELESLFFRRISDGGSNSGPLLLDDIEASATAALQRSDYELQVDDGAEIED